MSPEVTWDDLPSLLHDARLSYLDWRPEARDVSLRFTCLRRNVDGSAIGDPTVLVRVTGVAVLGVAYDATCRPSEFTPTRVFTAGDLRSWPCDAEPGVWVNNSELEGRFLESLRLDWLAGGRAYLESSRYRIGLSFGYGVPSLSILVGGDRLDAFTVTDPLPLDVWAAQYDEWWAGWRRHWAAKADNLDAEAEPVPEDLAIPAGIDPPPDPAYPWPDEPLVDWDPTGATADVLAALTAWYDAQNRQPDDGRRFYARQIDNWWVEGDRAGATVRGVEHSQPAGSYPASNTEAVEEFSLRRSAGGWAVRPLSRGWPPYGSAPARPAGEKPWLRRWRSGTVITERPVVG